MYLQMSRLIKQIPCDIRIGPYSYITHEHYNRHFYFPPPNNLNPGPDDSKLDLQVRWLWLRYVICEYVLLIYIYYLKRFCDNRVHLFAYILIANEMQNTAVGSVFEPPPLYNS